MKDRTTIFVTDKQLFEMYNYIIDFGVDYVINKYPNIESFVIGISGGIDSFLSLLIARQIADRTGIKVIGYSLPIITNTLDEELRAEKFGLALCDSFERIDLSSAFLDLQRNMYDITIFNDPIRSGNIKARTRMIFLYNLASKYKGLVLSTDNYTEYLLGFWTLHGDVGDLGFIQHLWKTEVYSIVRYLSKFTISDLCKLALEAKPTDGLGISDSDLDQLLPNWRGSWEYGYGHIDRVLLNHLNGVYVHNDWKHIIDRYLNTQFKRENPLSAEIQEKLYA